jgi:hypothetical protein
LAATPSATEPATGAGLALSPAEQTVLLGEVGPFAETLGDPALRARYGELHAAAAGGHVPPGLVGLVEALAELLLQTQRVRRRHGPEAERALSALYRRTPRGAALTQAADEVNTALAALRGTTLEEMSFSPTPGGYRLTITVPEGQLAVAIDRAGVRLERVELGSVG